MILQNNHILVVIFFADIKTRQKKHTNQPNQKITKQVHNISEKKLSTITCKKFCKNKYTEPNGIH